MEEVNYISVPLINVDKNTDEGNIVETWRNVS